MSKPLTSDIKKGTSVRIHGLDGQYLYSIIKRLNPGEEEVFTASIKQDDMFLQYSSKSISRGVYYIIPLLLSYSLDPQEDNSILIEDYSVTY